MSAVTVDGHPPVMALLRVAVAAVLTAALVVTSVVPGWGIPHGKVAAPALVLAIVVLAGWSCARAPVSAVLQAWTLITLVAVLAWTVVDAVGDATFLPFAPAAVSALLVLTAGEAERRAGTVTRVPAWLPVTALVLAGSAALVGTVADDPRHGLGLGVAALVVSAPGVVRLAGPVSMLHTSRRGSRLGLVVGARAPHVATVVDSIVLQQHGTVTTGDMRVLAVHPVDPDHDRNLRWFAGALAHDCDDRVGRAVARLATRGRLTDVEKVPERGVRGSVDRHPVRLGAPDWVGLSRADDLWTTVGVEVDGRPLGTLVVAEDTREHAAAAVRDLTGLGLDVILVSDDTRPRAEAVAREAGIQDVRLSQEGDSVPAVVQRLRRDGRVVAVVSGLPSAAQLTLGRDAEGPAAIRAPDDDVRHAVSAIRLARGAAASDRRAVAAAGAAALLGTLGVGFGLLGSLLTSVWAVGAATVVTLVATAGAPADPLVQDEREDVD